jgi:hypothetical protein
VGDAIARAESTRRVQYPNMCLPIPLVTMLESYPTKHCQPSSALIALSFPCLTCSRVERHPTVHPPQHSAPEPVQKPPTGCKPPLLYRALTILPALSADPAP